MKITNALENLYNQDVEDELSLYEDRLTLFKIDEFEKKLKYEEEQEELQQKEEKELREQERIIKNSQDARKEFKRQKKEKLDREKQIYDMLKLMKISKPEDIGFTYDMLLQNQNKVSLIIEKQKESILKTREEVEILKDEYRTQTLQGQEEALREAKRKCMVEGMGEEITESEEGTEPGKRKSPAVRGPNEMNKIDELEETLMKKNTELAAEEQSFQKMMNILQDSCTTVSRIMYQLEPKKVDICSIDLIEI